MTKKYDFINFHRPAIGKEEINEVIGFDLLIWYKL